MHLCHERVHTADTCPPALPGQGRDVSTVTLVSAPCSQLHIPIHPIPSLWPGNGCSREAERRAWGWSAAGAPLVGWGNNSIGTPEQPQVIRASQPLHTVGRALAEPWSRGAPAN